MSEELEKKVDELKVEDGPKLHPKPEEIYSDFTADLKAFFESVGGRVKLVHEGFNFVAISNSKAPPPPQFISFLLDLTEDQIKNAGPEGPVVTYDQFIGGIKKTIFENETKDDFNSKFIVHLQTCTKRMTYAKKLFGEIKDDLTKFHEKVGGSSSKLFDWFKDMVPADVKDQVSKEYFMAMVMRTDPESDKVPLSDFLFGLEANLDENDTAEKILAVCAKH